MIVFFLFIENWEEERQYFVWDKRYYLDILNELKQWYLVL